MTVRSTVNRVAIVGGEMQTVYRLKSNLTWHDGTGLSAGDFHVCR